MYIFFKYNTCPDLTNIMAHFFSMCVCKFSCNNVITVSTVKKAGQVYCITLFLAWKLERRLGIGYALWSFWLFFKSSHLILLHVQSNRYFIAFPLLLLF